MSIVVRRASGEKSGKGGGQREDVGGRGKIISDCETGNPPEGWESEGQLRIADLKARKQESGEAQSSKLKGEIVEAVEIVKSVEPESSKEWREREELSTEGPAQKGGAERSELVEMLELSWIGGGILLSGVFFDLSQFNFHGLLFPQKKEDHPHHQDQNHYHGEYNYVSKEVHHPPLARALWALEPSEFSVSSVREKQTIRA